MAPIMQLRRVTAHKHQQLASTLREMISGFAPGDRLPTVTDLEKHFGVANTTVEAAMAILQREGLIVRRRGSGTYVADHRRESMVKKLTGRIAILAMSPPPPIFSEMIHVIEASLSQRGQVPLLVLDNDPAIRMKRARDLWERGEIDGILHVGSHDLSGLAEVPAVVVGQTEEGGHSQVSADNEWAGQRVGEYLWGLGHRRVLVVGPTLPGLVADLRLKGLRCFWQDHGGAWHPEWEVRMPIYSHLLDMKDQPVADAAALLEPVLCGPDAPTAVFAFNDQIAGVVIRAVEALGKRVPEDVSVVGFDDAGAFAAHYRPALTTVRMPSAALGALAVQMLQERVTNPQSRPQVLRLPPELIIRASSGPPPPESQ